MTITTKTYDDTVYQLVPVHKPDLKYQASLPGVVTHSGETYAWTMTGKLKWQLTYDAGTAETWRELNAKVIPLYTHADPAEVEQLRQRVAELEAQLAAQPTHGSIGDMKWKEMK